MPIEPVPFKIGDIVKMRGSYSKWRGVVIHIDANILTVKSLSPHIDISYDVRPGSIEHDSKYATFMPNCGKFAKSSI